ncbi:GNAT family N-acetyltransferase [Gramella sp. AN32]|uniref:GNAT family N-acetyltransferase n=1 Tax=Christiangramia antarctica TaxID=2058158 RepID=A0ABW5X5N9_9FLAO|nr:GNAT family N-acetyltransferase [Gramella sp. AN32]MCM4154783.1 GNAT family N-acetyltransferase [Gramella sp. AN32]
MTILAEKRMNEPAFNKILKEDVHIIFPFLKKLAKSPLDEKILKERVEESMTQNYECFGVFLNEKLIGVFGLWFMTRHYVGKSCEIDHIIFDDAYRNKGFGKKMLDFIEDYTKEKGCNAMELNSYVENFPSHKFFMNSGMVARGFHFLKKF